MRITRVGLLQPDDPIFSGGVQMFTVRRPKSTNERTGGGRGMNTQVEEVLDFLNDKKMRATYGAVAGYLGVLPRGVGQLLGDKTPRASWVVSATYPNLPTDYPADKMHPDLERTSLIITTATALERGLTKWREKPDER